MGFFVCGWVCFFVVFNWCDFLICMCGVSLVLFFDFEFKFGNRKNGEKIIILIFKYM